MVGIGDARVGAVQVSIVACGQRVFTSTLNLVHSP